MIIWTLAWRNLWRHAKRSWITISAVGTAYVFLILVSGFFGGLTNQILDNGTELLLGHVQVHHEEYLPGRNLYDWIGQEPYDLDQLVERLRSLDRIRSATPRAYGYGLISTGEHSRGVQLMGVDPEAESQVSKILGSLVRGEGLKKSAAGRILLGDTMAKALQADIGSEVAVVTQSVDGSIGNDLYTVSGIFDSGVTYLDRSLALFELSDLQELLVLEDWQVHEIALLGEDPLIAAEISSSINSAELLPPAAVAENWGELLPQLKEYLQLAGGMGWFMITLVGIFAGIGTLNTMMMAVFERTREIGMLNALGLGPLKILFTFLAESVFLCILGLVAGSGVGILLNLYLSRVGLDLSRWTGEITMVDSQLDPILKAVWAWREFGWSAVGLVIAVLLATLIPAVRAARMDPVTALHEPAEN